MILPGSVLPVQTQKPRRAAASGKIRLVRNHEVKRSLEYGEICLVYGPQSGGSQPAAGMRFVLYLFDFVMFHKHVFFVCQKYKSPYYAEIWRLPNSRQNDDQNVQLLEQRHDQQCRKIVKKRQFPTSG